jgi:hypothetical protein
MIRYPEIEIKDSLLPSKKWEIDENGKWRAYSWDEKELSLPNYPVHRELPQELTLNPYSGSEYQQSFPCKREQCSMSVYYYSWLATNWTQEETDFLYELCGRFALRFPVIQDRFNESFKQQRTIEVSHTC